MKNLNKDNASSSNQSQEENGKDNSKLKPKKQTNIRNYVQHIPKTQKTNVETDKAQLFDEIIQTNDMGKNSENTITTDVKTEIDEVDDSFNITLDSQKYQLR